MTRTSYLRVYQPLSVFSVGERDRWLSQSEQAPGPEQRSSRWFVGSALPSRDACAAAEGAFIRRVDDELLVCPWRTRLRVLAGLLEFRGSLPEEVADAFVPEREASRAAQELAVLDRVAPDVRSHMLHANWHVPLRWFTAFADLDRILVEDRDGLRIRYETRLGDARHRLARAVDVLGDVHIDESITDLVRELTAWLEEFDNEGLLELDYGSVARSFSDEDLVDDRSAADLWACVDALAAGDPVGAATLFSDLSDRWAKVRAREMAN
ncbi:MAG: hypothetical protein ABR529_13840 [Actinomycetota bacterium]